MKPLTNKIIQKRTLACEQSYRPDLIQYRFSFLYYITFFNSNRGFIRDRRSAGQSIAFNLRKMGPTS